MTLKKDFLSLSALEKANLVKSLTDFFEKLYPPLLIVGERLLSMVVEVTMFLIKNL